MNIDPLISLAVSMHEQKGVYAVLLGSGVSRSAGIPTGWEVLLALASRVAALSKAKIKGERVANWYKDEYGEELNYSRLLDQLTVTSAERQQILKDYFEPKGNQAAQGIKVPTKAHRAIAELVAGGYVRVILTTNFDRLIEQAVIDKGIQPTVIASPDAAKGALPFAHSDCSIIKINGDYLDIRLKNTEAELSSYDKQTNKLLDQVFDEYGLIICGWSGEWDKALRAALERQKSRRFGVYWASRGEPTKQAQTLISFCRARTIPIDGADTFFPDLASKIKALDDLEIGDPISPIVGEATVKRYLPEDRFLVQLTDFVGSAIRDTAERLNGPKFDPRVNATNEAFLSRLQAYRTETEILQHMIVPLCQWGRPVHETLAASIIELATDYYTPGIPMLEVWEKLRFFPSALLLYAGGLAAITSDNYAMFAALVNRPKYRDHHGEQPLSLNLFLLDIFGQALGEIRSGYKTAKGASAYLSDVLKPLFKECIPQEHRYNAIFDRFEYLLALVRADDYEKRTGDKGIWDFQFRAGLYVFRNWSNTEDILRVIEREIEKLGNDWPPFKVGLFDGNTGRLEDIKRGLDRHVAKRRQTV